LTRRYAEGVAGHAGSPAEGTAGPGKVGQRSGRTARRSHDALLLAAECYPLIRQIGPAARVGLSKKGLRVAGATILAQQRCLRHNDRERGVGGASVALQVAGVPAGRSRKFASAWSRGNNVSSSPWMISVGAAILGKIFSSPDSSSSALSSLSASPVSAAAR
jgi:hypothetical protein